MSRSRAAIAKGLVDKEYRDAYVSEHIGQGIAFQIREMRNARGWSQADLGDRAGGRQQAWVSKLEDPDYGSFSLSTLKRLASAFDVALLVRFAPFSQLVDWASGLTQADLAVLDYEHDTGLREPMTGTCANVRLTADTVFTATVDPHGMASSQERAAPMDLSEHKIVSIDSLSQVRRFLSGGDTRRQRSEEQMEVAI